MINKFFKFLLVLICIYFIYKFFNENISIYEILKEINYSTFIILIIYLVIIIYLYANIFFILLKNLCKIKISKFKWYLIYFNSQFLNSVPLLGVFYRAKQLKKLNLNYDKFFGIYILINWFFVFLSLTLFSIESFFILHDVMFFDIKLYKILIILSLFFFIFPIGVLIISKKILKKINLKSNYVIFRIEKLIDLFLKSISSKVFLKKFILAFFFIHIFEFIILIQLIEMLNNNVDFKNSFIIFMGNILIDTVNILPQNLIISEFGLGLLTSKINFNFELGVIIKLYYRFLIFFASVFIAIIYNIFIFLKYIR